MCPQCTGTDVEEDMAKNTLHGGPSDATQPEEEPSPGNSGLTPSDSEEIPTSEEMTSSGKSARTTASRSGRGRKGSSTAHSTDTDREAK